MIPPVISPDAPPGERQVFQRLASDPQTIDWVVLHSLGLAQHVRQTQGEADFVVVVPRHGIAVIEVKSHKHISRDPDGRWRLGNHRPTIRGPFQQADEAMHSIRRYLRAAGADLHAVPIVNATWFTHLRARASLPPSPEWHDWQVLDLDAFRTGAARAVLRVLDRGRDHLSGRLPQLRQSPYQPDAAAAARFAAILRPRFDIVLGSADIRRDRETQLTQFLDEQYDALDAMSENRAVLFTGPAGCGKTFMAVEAAHRAQAAGLSGRLLCFNRLLSRHLDATVRATPSFSIGSLHSEMLRTTGVTPPSQAGTAFWDQLLESATDQMLEVNAARDILIVDEAQDLATPEYLDMLDLLVVGGLAGGRCLFFGDFERQALFGLADGRAELRGRITGLASHTLTANCRNRPRIGAAAEVLASMSPGYKRFRREDDGVQPRYYWYRNPDDQQAHTVRAVRDLVAAGYGLEDIILLSPRRASCAATATDPWLAGVLTPERGGKPRRGRLRHTTIHAFKGLEAPAIVLTDIDDPMARGFEALLYVGLTRPTDRLSVVGTREALRAKLGN